MEKNSETNVKNWAQHHNKSQLAGGRPVAYFQKIAQELNSGPLRTNPSTHVVVTVGGWRPSDYNTNAQSL